MKAVVLAAGRGTRLRPHTDHAPKNLLPFAGRPLLAWQRAALADCGVDLMGVVAGYRNEAFDDQDVRLWLNERWAETNMVYSLFCAPDALNLDQDLIISYGDIIYEPHVVKKLMEAAGDISVVVDRNWLSLWSARGEDPLDDAESLRINEAGDIADIGQKVNSMDEIEAQYIGLIKLTPEGQRQVREFYKGSAAGDPWLAGRTLDNCYMTDLIQGMIGAGYRVGATPVDGGWLEFDTVGDLDLYSALLESGELDQFFKLFGGLSK